MFKDYSAFVIRVKQSDVLFLDCLTLKMQVIKSVETCTGLNIPEGLQQNNPNYLKLHINSNYSLVILRQLIILT